MCKNCPACGIGFLKCLIVTFNTFLFIGGITMAAISGYAAFNKNSLLHEMIVKAHIPGALTGLYILLAVGILMSIISLLGCIGAVQENRLLLWLNLFFVLLLFIIELVAVILCFYKYKSIEKNMLLAIKGSTVTMTSEMKHGSSSGLFRDVVSFVEIHGKCCGLHGPDDYIEVPQSCYPESATKSQETHKNYDAVEEENDENIDNDDVANEIPTLTSTAFSTTLRTTTEPRPPEYRTNTSPPPTTPTSCTEMESTAGAATHAQQVQPYKKGCIAALTPIIYAAGGIAIAILLLELLLVIFIGILLCEIGKEYESLA